MCCFSPEIPLNVFGHSEQQNFRSESCSILCCFNWTNDSNGKPQVSHANFPLRPVFTLSLVSSSDGADFLSLRNMNLESSTMNLKLRFSMESLWTRPMRRVSVTSLSICTFSVPWLTFSCWSFGWFWNMDWKNAFDYESIWKTEIKFQ